MAITVSLLGVVLVVFIVAFIMNKRRVIAMYYPEKEWEEIEEGGILKLLTYNVAGLPEKLSSAKTPRYESIIQIGRAINGYDIVNVQEDFNYNIQLYSENLHPYKTAHRGKAVWGDGLNTFSNYSIFEFRRIAWKQCNGADCLTPKGFTLARIGLTKGVLLDVYNVHATAGNSRSSAKARRRNLMQLAEYITFHSSDRAVLVMGDFNAYYQSNIDNMLEFLNKTDLKDCWAEIYLKGKYPSAQDDFSFIPMLEFTNETESIDKILYRSKGGLIFKPLNYAIERDAFRNTQSHDLSDHLAVMAELQWQHIKCATG